MPRKLDMIRAAAEGKPLNVKSDSLEHELDGVEVQMKTLQPESISVPLIDETSVELPSELSLADILGKNKVLNSVRYFYFLLQSTIKGIRGDKALAANDPLFFGILFEESIQEAMTKMLGAVLKKPAEFFDGKLGPEGSIAVFQWVLKILTENTSKSNGESNPKN